MQTYDTPGAMSPNKSYPAKGLISSPPPKKVPKRKHKKRKAK
ncbi:MAG: hypothetical protein M0Z99_33915 [Betaproteobacteria bacterium]|nr:hypothetical protein [Betaproteobacteria bacterium]